MFVILSVPTLAIGKVTDDPNKPGAAVAPAADLKGDPKLAQKVTYTASKKTVAAIFDDLANSTGVVLKAGRNAGDWQVRDRKMNIFAKDVPLNELMNSMARVMKFKWEISGQPGARSYRLFMDRRSLLDAEAQRAREEKRAEEALAKKRENGLLQYAKLGDLSPADKAKLKTENPFMYFVANSGMGNSMGSFFAESPGALEAISSGQKFELNASSLSPKAQAGLVQTMQQMIAMEQRFTGGNSNTKLPEALVGGDMSGVSVLINHNLEMMQGMPQASMMLGEMRFQYKGGGMTLPMMDPDSAMTKLIGKALVQCEETGRPMDEVMKELGPEFVSAVTKQIKTDVGGEPLNEHPDDPALKKKIKMESTNRDLSEVQKALAEASKLAVVSDFFGSWSFPMGQIPAGELELEEALEKIGDNYTYNWDKRGGVIELRDRNWFKKRAAQIPEAWLDNWRNALSKNGTLEIDDLAQIAALTQEQITANLMGDDVLRHVIGRVYSGREVLRLYGSLDSHQRSLLFTAAGLPLRAITEDQWSQAEKSMQARGGGKLDLSRRCSILATRSQNGKIFTYKFALLDESKNELSSWNVVTPNYIAPEQPKEPTPAKPEEKKPVEAPKPADAKPAAADPLK